MSLPPTGTVTFLFTDIEGSTKLWEAHPDAMRPALARHDDLLRRSIQEHEGYVFKTVGDAFCAAFPTANQALESALAAQVALAAEPWELPKPLLVRMALHTGATEERGGDYFGPPLNRVARLMAAGHGGQVLLSEVTQGLVRDALPPTASLLDLSQHRLKDLGRPEQVFQLLHPSLPAAFPPLRSLDNPDLPNNLPQQTTSFIGREKQVEEVKALLGKTRLLTLTGAGGSGKTRLSLQVAADLLTGDGVWLVELAALADPALVPQAVAQVLGIKEEAGKPIQQTLVEALRAKRLLLVLDNCEHLVAACASLAADLLCSCPGVHLLASSREPLNVAGEQTYRVPSLSLPDPKKTQTVEALSQFEAVRLFIERAQAVQPSFTVTDQNAPAVVQMCWRLDGIPLALELAAARVRSLSVEEVNVRLDQRFRLLTGGARNTLPRQQTLRALVDWSHDLLMGPEKALLRRLSVFAGGWTLEGAERVCGGEGIEEWDVLDLLTGLVDKSLVVYEDAEAGWGRYRLLETVRQYSLERLSASGEREEVLSHHLVFFQTWAAKPGTAFPGATPVEWIKRLTAEHDNLRAALAWCRDGHGNTEDGLRLAVTVWMFWFTCGHHSEGRAWLEALMAPEQSAPPLLRARALGGAGFLAYCQGDYLGMAAMCQESLSLSRQAGDVECAAFALSLLAFAAFAGGDLGQAVSRAEESVVLSRQTGDKFNLFFALHVQGLAMALKGEPVRAIALQEEALAHARAVGEMVGEVFVLWALGEAERLAGRHDEAAAHQKECLRAAHDTDNARGAAHALEGLGKVAQAQGEPGRSARLFGAAAALREAVRAPREPSYSADFDRNIALTRSALGEAAFAAAWTVGKAMTLGQAEEYALSDIG